MRSHIPRFPTCSCPFGKVLPPTPSPISGFLGYCFARCRRGRGGGDGNGAVGSGRHWRNPCWRLPSNMGRGTWMQKVEGGTEDARGFAIAIVLSGIGAGGTERVVSIDRKSTRLNSSH